MHGTMNIKKKSCSYREQQTGPSRKQLSQEVPYHKISSTDVSFSVLPVSWPEKTRSSGTQASNSVTSTITFLVSSDINTRLWTGTTPPDVLVRFRESCWEWNVFSPPPGAPVTVHILHVASYVVWSPTPTRYHALQDSALEEEGRESYTWENLSRVTYG